MRIMGSMPTIIALLCPRGGRKDFVPHDARVHEWGTGKTRLETLIALGRKPVLVRRSLNHLFRLADELLYQIDEPLHPNQSPAGRLTRQVIARISAHETKRNLALYVIASRFLLCCVFWRSWGYPMCAISLAPINGGMSRLGFGIRPRSPRYFDHPLGIFPPKGKV